jgi:undecaprenyl-diphosphatase
VLLTVAFARGWTEEVDVAVLDALRGESAVLTGGEPHQLIETMRDITSLAGVGLIALIGLAVLGYLLLRRRWRAAILLVVLLAGTQASVTILKNLISRPRPDLVEHGAGVITYSYPSGHSSMAAAIALVLAWTAARMHRQGTVKTYFWVLGIGTAGLIGFSRMYLGVHWFSDVASGLLLGTTWACLCMGLGGSLECCGASIDRKLDAPPLPGPDAASPPHPRRDAPQPA